MSPLAQQLLLIKQRTDLDLYPLVYIITRYLEYKEDLENIGDERITLVGDADSEKLFDDAERCCGESSIFIPYKGYSFHISCSHGH